MPIRTLAEYQQLQHVELQPGDILLKKIFPGQNAGMVEKTITWGQSRFEKRTRIDFGDGESADIDMLGSSSSEHAAMVLSPSSLAEAVGEGVVETPIWRRITERYIVYRCTNKVLVEQAINVAKGLTNRRENALGGQRHVTGGAYNLKGAIQSNVRNKQFMNNAAENRQTDAFRQASAPQSLGGFLIDCAVHKGCRFFYGSKERMAALSTIDYLDHINDIAYGSVGDIQMPDMFCSEFVMACYEAGSAAALGKTAFGTDPRGMSPMEMENVLNGRTHDLVRMVGRFDFQDNPLFLAVNDAIEEYDAGLKGFSGAFRRQSDESRAAVEMFKTALESRDVPSLYYELCAVTGMKPAVPATIIGGQTGLRPISPSSTLYKTLAKHLNQRHLLVRRQS